MGIMTGLRGFLRDVLIWLQQDPEVSTKLQSQPQVQFDNSYVWMWAIMEKFMQDPVASTRPHYIWGIAQGAALAKVLGHTRIAVMEIGVGGGAGLVAMERVAELCEAEIENLTIDVYGFDTGTGIPKPQDYRDFPYKWSEGFYPCDINALKARLHRAELRLGLIQETVPMFLRSSHSTIAFVGVDLGLYSSAKHAVRVLDADHGRILPRMTCSFRCAQGKDMSDFTGELLAISEFNMERDQRKLSPVRGLTYFVPPKCRYWWMDAMYSFHIFDHPLYGLPESLMLSKDIDLDNSEHFEKSDSAADRKH